MELCFTIIQGTTIEWIASKLQMKSDEILYCHGGCLYFAHTFEEIFPEGITAIIDRDDNLEGYVHGFPYITVESGRREVWIFALERFDAWYATKTKG
jgi:hypothetical protein